MIAHFIIAVEYWHYSLQHKITAYVDEWHYNILSYKPIRS